MSGAPTRLHIAVLATSRHPLRQPWCGGQEAHTARLVVALRRRGHRVRLHAVAGTDPSLADEVVPYPELPPLSAVAALDPHLPEPDFLRDHAAFTAAVAEEIARGDADVVHNQSLHHLPLSMSAALPAPTAVTLHTPPFPWMELGIALADERARFVGVSQACVDRWTSLPRPADVVLNGVPDHGAGPGGDGLVWVGRMTVEKGPDLAIDAARLAGCPLRLVGPVSDPAWYAEHVAPRLGAGVEHVGHLDEAGTHDVVRSSAACLVTPRWDEPFGLVAAEAAMAGTPVVALARGGLTEVVATGADRVGVLVDAGDGTDEGVLPGAIAAAVPKAVAISREAVREAAVARLGEGVMVDAYERIFAEMAAG